MPQVKKAVMLSIFAFPGAGHFLLKRYKSGVCFLASFLIPAYFIIANIMQKAQVVADQIVRRELVTMDFRVISQAIKSQPDFFSQQVLTISWVSIIIIVQICAIDAYRQAKKHQTQ